MDNKYYRNERREVLNLIPNAPKTVLELGCGEGVFSSLLKQKYSCHITGIDICKNVISQAKGSLDAAYVARIDEFDFSQIGKFDLIVANDLLEHLEDPWHIVRILKAHLNSEGYFLASIPNVRYHKVITQLLKGNWKYTESGILDRTHLRFFTKNTMVDLFEHNGYVLESINPINVDHVNKTNVSKLLLKAMMPDMYALQFVIIAKTQV